jgi:hypothetical protein
MLALRFWRQRSPGHGIALVGRILTSVTNVVRATHSSQSRWVKRAAIEQTQKEKQKTVRTLRVTP